MSGALRVRSSNLADSEARPVFGPAGNKVQRLGSARKPMMKTLRNEENSPEEVVALAEESNGLPSSAVALPLTPLSHSVSIPSALSRQEHLLHSNLSLNASCSSDASSDSFHSRASTGRIYRRNSMSVRRKQLAIKSEISVSDAISEALPGSLQPKKSDPGFIHIHPGLWWATTLVMLLSTMKNGDSLYMMIKKLFELLIFSGALAELTWPAILNRRHIFREVPKHSVSEKKIAAPGSTASSLLSELKLRAIVDNARQISKVTLKGQIIKTYLLMLVHLHPPTMYFMGILSVSWMLLQQLKMAYNFGDQIVKFGNVEPDDDLLPKLASEALSNQDCEIPVVVLRQGALINLTVTPRAWQGRGLLGNVISESYDRLHGALMNSDASVRPARRQCPSRCVLNILSPLCQSIGVKGWLLPFKLLYIFGFCM
ncbi:unnamed protein product [Camellia sinensis]